MVVGGNHGGTDSGSRGLCGFVKGVVGEEICDDTISCEDETTNDRDEEKGL